jgi:hypothetical protein
MGRVPSPLGLYFDDCRQLCQSETAHTETAHTVWNLAVKSFAETLCQKEKMNMSLTPDPTFYPSSRMVMQATPERIDPRSSTYRRLVGKVDFPHDDNELHHFGWNVCSACLCPQNPHPHMERRYLIVPGIGSSRVHILDTKGNPLNPKIVKVIEPEEFVKKTGYTSPHTIHCGPDGIYGRAVTPGGAQPFSQVLCRWWGAGTFC